MKPTIRSLSIILGVLILVIVSIPVFIGSTMGPGMMGSMMNAGMMGSMMNAGMMGSMMSGVGQHSGWTLGLMLALGSLRLIAVVGALILGVLLVVRLLDDRPRRRGETETPALEIVQRRYAAGEVSEAEYEQMRQVLAR